MGKTELTVKLNKQSHKCIVNHGGMRARGRADHAGIWIIRVFNIHSIHYDIAY